MPRRARRLWHTKEKNDECKWLRSPDIGAIIMRVDKMLHDSRHSADDNIIPKQIGQGLMDGLAHGLAVIEAFFQI
jgi:hypothetical protein